MGNIHHFDMGTLLDRLGIAVRTGHHCAEPLMHRMGIEGTVRASLGLYNTKEEIDMTAQAKWVINCIAETKGRFGQGIVIGTLLGANRARQ